jgi:hypothetical protein
MGDDLLRRDHPRSHFISDESAKDEGLYDSLEVRLQGCRKESSRLAGMKHEHGPAFSGKNCPFF